MMTLTHDPIVKNGSRPSAYIHWGLPASTIAVQYAETYSSEAVNKLPQW